LKLTARVGNIAVKVATKANDLEDIKEGLMEDKTFLVDQAMELAALADTISSSSSRFCHPPQAVSSRFKRAPACVDALHLACSMLPAAHERGSNVDSRLELLEAAFRGGKTSFEKIIKMIDALVTLVKKGQQDDDARRSTAWPR